jgi:hypothetical protein
MRRQGYFEIGPLTLLITAVNTIQKIKMDGFEFAPDAVRHWFDAARALQAVAERLVCFIHPADRTMTDELKDGVSSDALTRFTQEIASTLGVEVLAWDTYDLQPDDFLDINHMNARGGREKLSRQLAAKLNL